MRGAQQAQQHIIGQRFGQKAGANIAPLANSAVDTLQFAIAESFSLGSDHAHQLGYSLSRGDSILAVPRPYEPYRKTHSRTRISCTQHWTPTACAAFSKESRMNFANATKLHRKSGEEREEIQAQRKPKRALGLFDSTMVVIGVMIGSGIFIVPADMARILGGPGWFLAAWVFAAVLTIAAAFSFGELASMMPGGGGMYLYLREAYSPLWGFLYGWTLFTVIQTGTIAAVAVAFARFLGVLAPSISESRYLITPIRLSAHYALTLSTAQLVAVLVIALLTATNTLGIEYGKIIQNSFTVAKLGALGALIVLGLTVGWNASAVHANLAAFWQRPATPHPVSSMGAILSLLVVFCVSQSGSLFAADSWHDITFASEEVKEPRTTLPRALAIGVVIVMLVYLAANIAYLAVLNFSAIQHADHDRVATAMLQQIFPAWGAKGLAVLIMVSTFGCINSLVLAGPRAYYAMARDRLFIPAAGRLNSARVPGWSLLMQGVWAAAAGAAHHVFPG